MKAKIKAIDDMFNRSVEIECSIRKDVDAAVELKRVALQRDVRQKIMDGLQLAFREARLELIIYGRIIANGTIRNNVFSGRNEVSARQYFRRGA